ncbi:Glu/Leu/Phe/Val family dehydrogenase [Candidatus Formimonas warabiya]|uniref:Leucine dehydrogenase n=1 Tax=Formimonas warabiya TaxID=1761012 RepID=A0A3G1KUR9_FORW1|nr:Glu/Leu/Phe/Val dehydrogenase dimerization domain-containing protein [Candidatus Formimonas warabiya]ATW26167.1 leucine dehydrogenase [Candidatus Formimonas warabiya]
MSKVFFEVLQKEEFEQVVYGYDKFSGLKAIIAIHNTALGPAFGGTRMYPYASEDDAIYDVLRLSKAMTYKNAAGGINFGGGKAIIIGDAKKDKTEDLLRAYGRLIEGLGGRFIGGVDIGTDEDDMVIVHQETNNCTALPEAYGGGGSTSMATAHGVYNGIKAAADEVFGSPSLNGKTVSIQGVGHIGFALAQSLKNEGAKVIVCDVDPTNLKKAQDELNVEVVSPEEIYDQEVDIFAPCAMGAILNDNTIPRLKCKMIAGSANNQLKDEDKHSKMLVERNIVFAVDYILSVGGCINNSHQFIGYNRERAYAQVAGNITTNIRKVLRMSQEKNITTVEAARQLAEQRIQSAINRKSWFLNK